MNKTLVPQPRTMQTSKMLLLPSLCGVKFVKKAKDYVDQVKALHSEIPRRKTVFTKGLPATTGDTELGWMERPLPSETQALEIGATPEEASHPNIQKAPNKN